MNKMGSFILGFLDTIVVDVIFVLIVARLFNSISLQHYRTLLLALYVIIPFIAVYIHLHFKSTKNYLAYLGVVVGIPVAVALSIFVATIISGGK